MFNLTVLILSIDTTVVLQFYMATNTSQRYSLAHTYTLSIVLHYGVRENV